LTAIGILTTIKRNKRELKAARCTIVNLIFFSLGINEITEPSFTKVTKKILKKNKILMNRK